MTSDTRINNASNIYLTNFENAYPPPLPSSQHPSPSPIAIALNSIHWDYSIVYFFSNVCWPVDKKAKR